MAFGPKPKRGGKTHEQRELISAGPLLGPLKFGYSARAGNDIIKGVDVLITPEARREIEALMAIRPLPSTWGILIGHKRGFRFIVEKIFPAGSGRVLPNERVLAGLDGIWPGRVIGLFSVRPGIAFRKAVLSPGWYGKLVFDLGLSAQKRSIRPYIVEFKTKFFLARIPLVTAGRAKTHE